MPVLKSLFKLIRLLRRGAGLASLCLPLGVFPATSQASDLSSDVRIGAGGMDTGVNSFNHGYVVKSLTITNLSQVRSQNLVLWTDGGHYRFDLKIVRRLPELKPGESFQAQWISPGTSSRLFAAKSGYEFDYGNSLSITELHGVEYHSSSGTSPRLFLSRGIGFDAIDKKLNPTPAKTSGSATLVNNRLTSSSPDLYQFARAEMEVEGWFRNWLAYSSYDAMVLTSGEFSRLSGDTMDAILRYVECGGTVCVFGKGVPPESLACGPATSEDGVSVTPVGFGQWCEISDADSPGALTDTQVRLLDRIFRNSILKSAKICDKLENFKIVENYRIPFTGVAICIVLFVILAGPVNLFVLVRKNRRAWLLWTTPIISVVFSGALVVYFFFSEGIGARGRFQSVAILNEKAQRACALGVEGFYCPLPPRSGVFHSFDWEITPRRENGGGDRYADFSVGQWFISGFVRSRVQAQFALRGGRRAVERLQLRLKNGHATAVNGLGAPIRTLLARGEDGALYEAENVAAGAEIALAPKDLKLVVPASPTHRSRFFSDAAWMDDLGGQIDKNGLGVLASWLSPGHYVAILDKTVFLEQGLRKLKTRQELEIVLGISAGTENGGVK